MKKQITNILKIIFFLGLGLLFIWLALRGITPEEREQVKQAIKQADYVWILASFLVAILSHYFRAVRWKMLLAPLGFQPKVSNSFFSIMIGYLANLALPRLGEITRCGTMNQYEKVPFTVGFGTVITERVFDVICLLLLFLSVFLLEFNKIYELANEILLIPLTEKLGLIQKNSFFLMLSVAMILLIILLFYLFRKKLQTVFSSKIKVLLKGLWDGLSSIRYIQQPVLFSFYTIAIWLLYVLQVYVCFFAFSQTSHLTFVAAMVLNVFGSVAIILIPGGTGLFQAILIQILTGIYFIDKSTSIAFAWSVWSAQIIIILAMGLLSLILLQLMNKKNNSERIN